MVCQEIKCDDYLTDDGEPAWCFWAGSPAIVAVNKCPKAMDQDKGRGNEAERCNRKRDISL